MGVISEGEAMSTTVITICSLGHADVWRLTTELMPRFVEADDYLVFVPEQEVEVFREITNKRFEVHSQDDLGAQYREELHREVLKSGNEQRFGWYWQQFLKIDAVIKDSNERQIIWDADCVPLTEIELFDGQGLPVYMRATEFHGTYFDAIERLTGLKRIQDFSFVIPGFPIFSTWMEELIDEIEQSHGVPWFRAIMMTTDFSQRSGFSETETMGTWIANRKPNQWTTSVHPWERRGQSRFGFAKDFSPQELVALGKRNGLEIVSFENWDLPSAKASATIASRLQRIFSNRLKR